MLNMIKMDVYRMFRTKSMYVIWIILLASALLTSFLSKIDYDAANKEWEKQQAVEEPVVSNNSGSSTMVWIPKSGKKYHRSSSCSNMKNPSQVTLEKAQSLGYTPCSKCY